MEYPTPELQSARGLIPRLSRTLLKHLGPWVPPLLLVMTALGVWEGMVQLMGVPRWLLPPPSAIVAELVESQALLFRHAWITFQEVIAGFALSMFTGIILAVGIAYWRILERTAYPFVIASQTVPIIAIAPLLLIWVGYGMMPKVIVVMLISFFPIVVNMVDGLKSVDPDMVSMMRTLGATRLQLFTKVQLPTSLPFLFSGIKIAVAVSVIGAVIGEWVGASAGLGYLMIHSVPQFLTARVFAAIVILSSMGIALFVVASILERFLLPWYHTERRSKALRRG